MAARWGHRGVARGQGGFCGRPPGGGGDGDGRGQRRARRGRRIPKGARHVDQAPGQEPLSSREEQQLVARFLLGDEEAIRQVYQRFGRPVYTLGVRLLGSSEAAEELTQDVFLTAWRKAARFDAARGRLSTWLMAVAHNLAVGRLRRERGAARPHLVFVDQLPGREAGRGPGEPIQAVTDRAVGR